MTAGVHNFICEQGATWRRRVVWKAGSPAEPVNLTGCIARMSIRATPTSDVIADVSCSIPAPLTGAIDLELTAPQTTAIPAPGTRWNSPSNFVFDLEVQFLDGTVTRVLNGTFSVSPEVTR